ncbi:type II toxin-antitoxin system TacA family antitoxin [Nitrospira sp. M1]
MNKQSVKPHRKSHPKNINLRVKPHTRSLIDRACAITDKTVTEFVLDVVCREAEDVLLDRRLFNLGKKDYQAFINALDAPTQPNPKLKELLNRKPIWES